MTTNYNQIYPYNSQPQSKSIELGQPKPSCLKCPSDNELQAVIFDKSTLAIVKGYEWKSEISIKEIFVPAKDYIEYEFTLKQQSSNEFTTLNYGNLLNKYNGVDFIAIIPLYHNAELEDQSYWHINFRFIGEEKWKKLGRFFMWSAISTEPVPVIELQNLQTDEIKLKIMIAVGY